MRQSNPDSPQNEPEPPTIVIEEQQPVTNEKDKKPAPSPNAAAGQGGAKKPGK
jgi:hypothetical protein